MLNGQPGWQLDESYNLEADPSSDQNEPSMDFSTVSPTIELDGQTPWAYQGPIVAQPFSAPNGSEEAVSYYETMLDKQQWYYEGELQDQMNHYEGKLQQQAAQLNEQQDHLQQQEVEHQSQLQANQIYYMEQIEKLEAQLKVQQGYFEDQLQAQQAQFHTQVGSYQAQLQEQQLSLEEQQLSLEEQQSYYEATLAFQQSGFESQLEHVHVYYQNELSQAQGFIESQQQAWEEDHMFLVSNLQDMALTLEWNQSNISAYQNIVTRLDKKLSDAQSRAEYLEKVNSSNNFEMSELERAYQKKCDDYTSTNQKHQVDLLRKEDEIRSLEVQQQAVLFHFEQQAKQEDGSKSASASRTSLVSSSSRSSSSSVRPTRTEARAPSSEVRAPSTEVRASRPIRSRSPTRREEIASYAKVDSAAQKEQNNGCRIM